MYRDHNLRPVALARLAALIMLAASMNSLRAEQHSTGPIIREIVSGVDHNHCTTRQFQHMTFRHQGVWFVFYSDGKDFRYQTSADGGRTWQPASVPVAAAPNGSTSFDVLKFGDQIIISHVHYPLGRYDVNAPYAKDPSRRHEYRHEGRIKRGRIRGHEIQWLEDVNPGFTPDYSNVLQDDRGFFWVVARESGKGVAYRSRGKDEITQWMPKTTCIPIQGRHAMDAAALDGGRLYVVSMQTTDGTLYGNLYDGDRWRDDPVLISDHVTTVAGDDRRLAIEFDRATKALHLVFVDASSRLCYRRLSFPYQPDDWWPSLSHPAIRLADGVFTTALSLDNTSTPNELIIVYGDEQHVGSDKRQRTGSIFARAFDGREWSGEPILMSQRDTIHNWYPNVNRDAGDGLCVLYSRSMNPADLGKPLAIMVSVHADQ